MNLDIIPVASADTCKWKLCKDKVKDRACRASSQDGYLSSTTGPIANLKKRVPLQKKLGNLETTSGADKKI